MIFATHSEYVLRAALTPPNNNDMLIVVLKENGGVIEPHRVVAPSVLPSITSPKPTILLSMWYQLTITYNCMGIYKPKITFLRLETQIIILLHNRNTIRQFTKSPTHIEQLLTNHYPHISAMLSIIQILHIRLLKRN